jgi:hypothetical protein
MNRFGSHPNDENQQKNFNPFDPPQGHPVGGDGVYHFFGAWAF